MKTIFLTAAGGHEACGTTDRASADAPEVSAEASSSAAETSERASPVSSRAFDAAASNFPSSVTLSDGGTTATLTKQGAYAILGRAISSAGSVSFKLIKDAKGDEGSCFGVMSEAQLGSVETFVKLVNPQAEVLRTTHSKLEPALVFGKARFSMQRAEEHPQWLQEAREHEHTPETIEYGISSFVFRAIFRYSS